MPSMRVEVTAIRAVCFDGRNELRPLIWLPNNAVVGIHDDRVVTLNMDHPPGHIEKLFKPIEWSADVASPMPILPGTWLQNAVLDSYRLGEGVRGVGAVFMQKRDVS